MSADSKNKSDTGSKKKELSAGAKSYLIAYNVVETLG